MELANIHYSGYALDAVDLPDLFIENALFYSLGIKKEKLQSSLLHTLRRTYAEGKISTQKLDERKPVLERKFQSLSSSQTVETDKNKIL